MNVAANTLSRHKKLDRQGACCRAQIFPMRTSRRRVWDMASGTQIHQLEGHSAQVLSVAISPDNKQVVSGSHDRTVR
jgi:WD40 repeat protein